MLPRHSVYIRTTVYYHVCIHLVTVAEITPSTSLPLPVNWENLCPYTDFCTYKAARSTENLTINERPCCETCSCDADCGLRRNCCQESMDKYRLDEKYRTKCISLTYYGRGSDLQDGNTYMVVVECPDESSCYNFTAAPWGSMYPVVSDATSMIYLNKQCARCHSELAVTQWDAAVNCQSDYTKLFISEGLSTVLYGEGIAINQCSVSFSPPKHTDVSFQYCTGKQTVRSCTSQDVFDKNISKQCESFNASFTFIRTAFANVYCYLCANPLTIPTLCAVDDMNRAPLYSISVLLTPKLIQDLRDASLEKSSDKNVTSCQKNEVEERQTGRCRKRRCPEGQLEMDERCSFISPEWTVGPFVTFLKLTPIGSRSTVSHREVSKISKSSATLFRNHLKTWKRNVYHYTDNNASYVEYFVLELRHKRGLINMNTFLDGFKKELYSPWTLSVEDKSYTFNAQFYKFYQYMALNTNKKYFRFTSDKTAFLNGKTNMTATEDLESVKITYESKSTVKLALTKSFFCDQVDLKPEEYDDYDIRIFFKTKNKFLEKAEFRRLTNGDGSSSISVCLSDFGDDFWVMSGSILKSDTQTQALLFVFISSVYIL